MVRVLSCYHFRGQKIGRCEEASAVIVAGQSIVVGIEDAINVYSAGHGFQYYDTSNETNVVENTLNQNITEIGAPIIFSSDERTMSSDGRRIGSSCSEPAQSGSCSSSVSSIESDTEIKLSHSFSTVDLINSMSYNKKGHYLLCLEGRSVNGGSSNIRIYFHWSKKCDVLQMRTRIAGVSPSTNDLEKPCLVMVEIPLTSPAVAAASCSLTGHLTSISAESIINIFSYRVKEASGRVKLHYPDFDRLCTVEIPGMSPNSLSFGGNFISCTGYGKVHVFKMNKPDKSWSTASANKFCLPKKSSNPNSSQNGNMLSKHIDKTKENFDHSNKVTYDPNDDSVIVHLPSITRANRKRMGNSAVVEEYTTEISSNKSRIIFSSSVSGVEVEDIVRLSLPPQYISGQDKFVRTDLYPLRVKDKLGSVTCVVGMCKDVIVYHLSTKETTRPIRIASYSFTAPLVSFTFDSLFFHALTESGLETYTSRSLCYALQDHEGFERLHNACPLINEPPCLVGIRPFVRVRFMAAAETLICLLTCPTLETPLTNQNQTQPTSPMSPTNSLLQDEKLWTIYSLELPDADMLYEDTMRVVATQEGQSDSYLTLLCELHLILRMCINLSPEEAHYYIPRYQKLCRSIGLELLKLAPYEKQNENEENDNDVSTSNNNSQDLNNSNQDMALGVTYLIMSGISVQDVFNQENTVLTLEPKYVQGTVMLIHALLSQKDSDKYNISPSLSTSIVDFLSRVSPETLVELVLKVPSLRENQSKRLVEILQEYTILRGYRGKETVALILTLIASGGVESNVRSQVENVLKSVNIADLTNFLSLEYILDRSLKHTTLTDVAICLIAVDSDLPTSIISSAMSNHEIAVSEVMLAFAKGVNLNSESQIQLRMAKALRIVLEHYLIRLINGNNEDMEQPFDPDNTCRPTNFNEDDRHAALAIVRSYLSDITFSSTASKLFKTNTSESSTAASASSATSTGEEGADLMQHENVPNETENPKIGKESHKCVGDDVEKEDITSKNQIFGRIPSFVNFLLSVELPGGTITPSSMQFCSSMFSSKDSMDSYIRLLSLLSSSCGKVEGVKDSVLSFVYNNSSSVKSTPLQLILHMFCEPVETAISILISRQPTTVLLYAKEMFGKSPSKWKILVTQLKKRINLNPESTDSDMFSTIIESVYLHLANTLSLAELEQVLEKGTDDVAKFRSTCKRVELANSYASMVIQISTDYLQNHK